MDSGRTAHPTALLIASTVVLYVLDYVKSLYLYARFGPEQLDAYFGSYVLLEAVIHAAMLTALAAVLMPALAEAAREGGRALAERLGATVLLGVLVVLSAAAVLGVAFAPQVLSVYGFRTTPEGVWVARLVFAVLPLFGADKVLRLLLEHQRRFGLTVAASFVLRVVFLAVVFGSAAALGVVSSGAAALAAAGAAAGFLFASYLVAGGRVRRPLPLRHALLRRTGALLLPLGAAGFLSQAALVDSVFASYFGDGALSLLQLALVVYAVPVSLFCVSVSTAIFPRLCDAGAAGDRAALQRHLAKGIRRAMYFTVPAMLGLMVLARPLVRVIFQHGRFQPYHTSLVANCLAAYSVGLMAAGMRPILARALFAVHLHRWFIGVELLTLALNVGFNVWFAVVLGWGIIGIAFSTAVASVGTVAVMGMLVARRIGTEEMAGLGSGLVRMLGCAALMAVACEALRRATAPAADPGTLLAGVRLALVVVFGAAFYFAATGAARVEEFGECRALLLKFIGRKREAG